MNVLSQKNLEIGRFTLLCAKNAKSVSLKKRRKELPLVISLYIEVLIQIMIGEFQNPLPNEEAAGFCYEYLFYWGSYLKDCCYEEIRCSPLKSWLKGKVRDSSKMKITFSSCDVTLSQLSLSCGTGGQVRHLKVKRPNVAHRLPRGKRATWNGNLLLSKTTKGTTTAKKTKAGQASIDDAPHSF